MNRNSAEFRRSTQQPGYRCISREEYLMRAVEMAPRGDTLPQSKLNDSIVREIRANVNGWPRRKWAEKLNLHIRTIDKVCTYETWRHVK